MKDLKFDKNLEELILSKEYKLLDNKEKEIVLNTISEKEYYSFRKILLSVNKHKSQEILTNNKEDLDKLLLAFDKIQTSNNDSIIRKIFEYTLPVYKIAVGMLLILTLSYIINMKFFPSSHERIVFITDTIYKQVLIPENIWLADSSVKADYYKSDVALNNTHKTNVTVNFKNKDIIKSNEIANFARHVGILTDRDLIVFRRKHNGGKSLYEDSVIKDFLVTTP